MIGSRDEAWELLSQHVKGERMLRHCLASEAVLRALAERTGADPDAWGMAGLLHDIDMEITEGDLTRHGLEAERLLAEAGLDPELVDAIARHNEEACDRPRETTLQHLLSAGETITGLIVATALVYPDKKLASVKPKSITKRMKQKAFAASVRRDHIRECEVAGIELPEFAAICLEAMKGISDELGL